MINLSQTDFVTIVEEGIRDGRSHAVCIPWNESHDANRAIAESCAAFEAAGWQWNIILEQLEKGGWYGWFRSQGALASPIFQWGRISTTPQYESPNKQFSLF